MNSDKRPHTTPSFATGNGIICAGLPRSGTASLAKALEILNVGKVHHALQETNLGVINSWEEAAYCTFPYWQMHARRPPSMSRWDAAQPWTREQWLRLIGQYRAVTDIYAPFSETLIDTFPEAKVILVERNMDTWAQSYRQILRSYFYCWSGFILSDVAAFLDFRALASSRAVMHGWLETSSYKEVVAKLPAVHERHYAMVRRKVPKEQLLDFKLDQGWEPLCEFLNVPVPDEPFPHINEMANMMRIRRHVFKVLALVALLKLVKWGGGVMLLAYSWRRWNGQLASIVKEWLMMH